MAYQYYAGATTPSRWGTFQLSDGNGSSPEESQYAVDHLDASPGGGGYGGQWACSEMTLSSGMTQSLLHSSNQFLYPLQDLGTPLSNFEGGDAMIPISSLRNGRYGDMAEKTALQYQEQAYEGFHLNGNNLEDMYSSASSFSDTPPAIGPNEMCLAAAEGDFATFGSHAVQESTLYTSSDTSAGFVDRQLGGSLEAERGRPFHCVSEGCIWSFLLRKDLDRHYQSTHSNDPPYRCRCTYYTTRKDNFRRHVKTCAKFKQEDTYFTCCCGHQEAESQQILSHIDHCNLKRRGRPPKN